MTRENRVHRRAPVDYAGRIRGVEGERYIDTHIVPEIWGTKFWQKYKLICKDLLGDKREREREREKMHFFFEQYEIVPFQPF